MNMEVTIDAPVSYFAFGAMANKISRKRREIHAQNERPAVLPNFKLIFEYAGAASIEACGPNNKTGGSKNVEEGAEAEADKEGVHGVLMELDAESWQNLKDFEKGYDIVQEKVFPYGQQEPVLATLFRFLPQATCPPDFKMITKAIPQERYLKVISMGLIEHGVDKEYVQRKILDHESTPSVKPEDYHSFPEAPTLSPISFERYTSLCASSKPCFIVGKRVFQFDSIPDHPFFEWVKENMIGQEDSTWKVWCGILEPDFPVLESKQDLTELHSRWAEHQLHHNLGTAGMELPTVRWLLEE